LTPVTLIQQPLSARTLSTHQASAMSILPASSVKISTADASWGDLSTSRSAQDHASTATMRRSDTLVLSSTRDVRTAPAICDAISVSASNITSAHACNQKGSTLQHCRYGSLLKTEEEPPVIGRTSAVRPLREPDKLSTAIRDSASKGSPSDHHKLANPFSSEAPTLHKATPLSTGKPTTCPHIHDATVLSHV
jgi:hypothetical protein